MKRLLLIPLLSVFSLSNASLNQSPTHRRTARLEISTNGTRRTLTISTVSMTMVNGELVRCKVCGSHEITESITIDDATHGFCAEHKGGSEAPWQSVPGVVPEKPTDKE